MAELGNIADPNAGVVIGAGGAPSVNVNTGVAAPDMREDPLLTRIKANMEGIAGVELGKALKKDAMRGALMAAQGKSIQDVRKDAPWVEQIFGQGATITGAQSFLLQKAQDDYQLNLIANMEDLRKLTPEQFREQQIEDFDQFLTGDEDTDTQMFFLSQQMFAKGAESHMKEHLPYVQEVALNNFTEAMTSAAMAFEQGMEANPSPEKAAELKAEFAEKMSRPPGMYDDTYKTVMATVTVQRMKAGREYVRDMVDEMGVELDAQQLFAIQDSKGAWARVREEESATQIGIAMDRFLDEAESMKFTDNQLVSHMEGFARTVKGFAWTDENVTRVLQVASNARDAARKAAQENLMDSAWLRGKSLFGEDTDKINQTAAGNLARTWLNPAGAGQVEKDNVITRLVEYNIPNPSLKGLAAAAFANPITNNMVNPQIAQVYPIMKAIQVKNPTFFASQFSPETVAQMVSWESLGGQANQENASIALQQIAQVPYDPEMTKRQDYVTSKDDAIKKIGGTKFQRFLNTFSTNPNLPQEDIEAVSTEFGKMYDVYFQGLRNPEQAAVAAEVALRGKYTIINQRLVNTQDVNLAKVMNVESNNKAKEILQDYATTTEPWPGRPDIITKGLPPTITPTTQSITFRGISQAGEVVYKTVPLATISAEYKAKLAADRTKVSNIKAQAAFEERLSEARRFFMEKVPAPATSGMSPKNERLREFRAGTQNQLRMKPGIPENISDVELVHLYVAEQRKMQTIAGKFVESLVGQNVVTDQWMRDNAEKEEQINQEALKYRP